MAHLGLTSLDPRLHELSLVEETLELGCPLFDPLAILARRAVAIAKGADGGVPRS